MVQTQDADNTTARAQLTDGELSTSVNPAYDITKTPSDKSKQSSHTNRSSNSYYSLKLDDCTASKHSKSNHSHNEGSIKHSDPGGGSRKSHHSAPNEPYFGPYFGQIDPDPDDPIVITQPGQKGLKQAEFSWITGPGLSVSSGQPS